MLGHEEFTVGDYLAILRRRLWWMIIPALLGPLAGYLISRAFTPRYTSESSIVVEQPEVPENFVKSVVTANLLQRLMTMEGQVLSRNRLQPIIDRYGLYRDQLQAGLSIEDLVDTMRQATTVSPVQDFTSQGPPPSLFSSLFAGGSKAPTPPPASVGPNKKNVVGFIITFTADKPRVAQQVCSEIASLFITENVHERERSAQGTTDFLSNKLDEARRELNERDAKLADFKRRYFGGLPGDEQTNLRILTTLGTELETVGEQLSRAEQDKAYAESTLATLLAAQQSESRGDTQTHQQQLAKMNDALIVLEGRYTSDHPDVLKLKGEIAHLEKTIAAQTPKGQDNSVAAEEKNKVIEPPQIHQLRALIHNAKEIIRARSHEQERLKQQIKLYEARIQMAPVVEQQFKDLTRDYTTALKFYDELLDNRNESQMSTDVERGQKGEQFQIQDTATLPDAPSFPNRLLFALGGLGGGMGLGLGLLLVVEARDKSLRTDRDVKHYLGLPTLVIVPTLESRENAPPSFWRRWGKVGRLPPARRRSAVS